MTMAEAPTLNDFTRQCLQEMKDSKYGGLRWYPDDHNGFFEVPGGTRFGEWQVEQLLGHGFIRAGKLEYYITAKGIRYLKDHPSA